MPKSSILARGSFFIQFTTMKYIYVDKDGKESCVKSGQSVADHFQDVTKKVSLGSGKEIEAVPERWVWTAIFGDGSELRQFGEDGKFHRIQEAIDKGDIKIFRVSKFDEPAKKIELALNADHKIFMFYQKAVLRYRTKDERKIKICVFGFQNQRTKTEVYNCILPDDTVVQSEGRLNFEF